MACDPFYILNADTFWIDQGRAEPHPPRPCPGCGADGYSAHAGRSRSATGHTGGTDFLVGGDGALKRAHNDPAGLIYAGAAIVNPAIFAGAPEGPLSLNRYFDEAIAQGRLFGMAMRGSWITVGTPDAIPLAEAAVERALAGSGMSGRTLPRVFSIPPGAAFLPTLADALLSGRLVPDFRHDGDPLKLAGATIYVPTRRAARELRAAFVEKVGGRLGDPADGEAARRVRRGRGGLRRGGRGRARACAADFRHRPPAASGAAGARLEKKRLPAHVAALFDEEMVVPASAADAIWLARDLAALMDEIETEGSDWTRLAALAPENLSGWWQVTLDFLSIVTQHWPDFLVAHAASRTRRRIAAR